MDSQTYRLMLEIFSIIMLVFHSYSYKKINGDKVNFPLYIYFAMFPFKFDTIFPYYDFFIKGILIYGIVTLMFTKEKIKINFYEIIFLSIVFITGIINLYKNNYNLVNTDTINLVFVLLFSFYAFNSIKNKKHFNQIIKTLIVNSIVIGLCAIIEHHLLGVARPKVLLGNPSYLALYVYQGIISLYFIYKKIKFSTVVYTIVMVYSLIISNSDTIFLMFLVQVIYLLFLNFKFKNSFKLFGIILFTIIVFYMFQVINTSNVNGIMSDFIKGDDSRIYIWKGALESFSENIFSGVGYGNLLISYGTYEYVTHNDFLRILGETGIFGSIIIGIYLIGQYGRIIKFEVRTAKFLGFYFITILLFVITHNNMNSILFWWFISLPLYDSLNFDYNMLNTETNTKRRGI
ncbi:MAG: O-antigen ligase family protein [Clostridia bacterium]|nr:O-antigen ligase family protein [Clostridia bacterium]MDD4386494.1 O-antigen ligase family protein [Clostridia bacterium]